MLTFSSLSLAGPGHGHSHGNPAISLEKTKAIGRYHVERLVKSKKIDASWSSSTYAKSEKKKFGKKVEWIVIFENKSGVKGKKIYIFLNLSGEYIAANFTGR